MTTNTRHRLVEKYLDRLKVALHDVPRKAEVIEEVAEHLDAAVAEAAQGGPVTPSLVRTVLERMGDPDDIARAAREELPPPPMPRSFTTEWVALALVLFGGAAGGVGWIVGLVPLWQSPVWSRNDKLVGTLAVPGSALLMLLTWPYLVITGASPFTGLVVFALPVFASWIYTGWRLGRRLLAVQRAGRA